MVRRQRILARGLRLLNGRAPASNGLRVVRRQRILARGLRQTDFSLNLRRKCHCSVRRQRILARGLRQTIFYSYLHLHLNNCQKTANPRQGIKTKFSMSICFIFSLVRRQRILARGLRHTYTLQDTNTEARVVRRQRILARGLRRYRRQR